MEYLEYQVLQLCQYGNVFRDNQLLQLHGMKQGRASWLLDGLVDADQRQLL